MKYIKQIELGNVRIDLEQHIDCCDNCDKNIKILQEELRKGNKVIVLITGEHIISVKGKWE